MSNTVNCQNKSIPAYSGVTINITNPTLNAGTSKHTCQPDCQTHCHCNSHYDGSGYNVDEYNSTMYSQNYATMPNDAVKYNSYRSSQYREPQVYNAVPEVLTDPQNYSYAYGQTSQIKDLEAARNHSQNNQLPSYPQQYYLNNYNYIQGADKNQKTDGKLPENVEFIPENIDGDSEMDASSESAGVSEDDENKLKSQQIIEDLNMRIAEEKELEKNGLKSEVVALTNEYIMSLENFLNDPKKEMRRTAATEVLDRLGEDRSRYDDAALNALLNKMLQDPDEIVRAAALGAFSSQLASGNDYTVVLLSNIQNNPHANTVDVEQAAQSLLKMTTRTEVRYNSKNNYPQESVE